MNVILRLHGRLPIHPISTPTAVSRARRHLNIVKDRRWLRAQGCPEEIVRMSTVRP